MPTTDDYDKALEKFRLQEQRQAKFFKVIVIVGWVIVTIIVVALCLYAVQLSGYFSVPNPIDAIPTFSQ